MPSVQQHLERLARRNGGFVTRREALELGFRDNELQRVVAGRHWTKVRPGVYAPATDHKALSETDQHLLLLRSVLRELGPDYVASHHSAVVAHGLATYRHGPYKLDLAVAHVSRIGGTTSRRTSSIQYHRGAVDPDTVTTARDLRVTNDVQAVIETLTTTDLEPACVVASRWLGEQRFRARLSGRPEEFDEDASKQVLYDALARVSPQPGSRTARDAIAIADACCESVAEVRFLVLCWEYGIPRPRTQVEVPLPDGGRADVDFLWEDVGLVVEVDGMLKYEETPGGPSAKSRVRAEKNREVALRDLNWHVHRVTWADLEPENRDRTVERLRRELARAARMRAANSRPRRR